MIFENGTLTSSITSQEFITIGILIHILLLLRYDNICTKNLENFVKTHCKKKNSNSIFRKFFILNPFSHYVFCVSRLTASCHMRHPLKKMKTNFVSVCVSVRPNTSREMIQNRVVEVNFYVFRYNFACRPPI